MSSPDNRYIVICLDDDNNYRLTTRQTFDTKPAAQWRADSCAPSRKALVVACHPDTVILRKEQL